MPGVGNGVCNVLVGANGDDLYLDDVVKEQCIGICLEFIRHQDVAIGSLNNEGTACAGIINREVEMVGGDLLYGGLCLGY